IIEVHDYGISHGVPYLIMELMSGQPLDKLIEMGRLSPEDARTIARQILSGLGFAHSQGVIHRDLKTENVFVTRGEDGEPIAKLFDFGLVKFLDEGRWGSGDSALTTHGEVFGTPAYMSPEQAVGAPTDPRTDVYSAGVVIFELLTGTWPF